MMETIADGLTWLRNGTTVLPLILAWATFISLMETGEAVWLTLPTLGHKCVSEEIKLNVVVLAQYVVVSRNITHQPTVFIKVTSPKGNVLHERDSVTGGQFAFTTKEAGSYFVCFWMAERHSQGLPVGEITVDLKWRVGFAAKDWESFARKEKIEGVELELRKLEESVEFIHESLLSLKSKEAEMRVVSERTNTRVARYSIMSLAVCIVASALQLWHLKRFFHKKKLIYIFRVLIQY